MYIYVYIYIFIYYIYVCVYIYYIYRGNIPIFRKSSHTMSSSYSRPGFWYVTLIGISAQSGGNSWGHGEPTECPPTAFHPPRRSKAAVDAGWIEGCFDKGVSSFVYRRRTGLSKVTFLKVGWVKISQFLPRGLTQGELGKNRTHWCAPGSLGWLWLEFWFWPRNFPMWSLNQPRILRILRIP